MDTTNTIIGAIIVLIIVLPIVAIQRSQTSKKKKSRKAFIDEALKNNLTVNEPDFWGSYYAIALDTNKNKLIYSKIIDEAYNTKIIDLNQVSSCAIVRTNRTFKTKGTFKTETDKIDLVIEYVNANKLNKEALEFYNVDVNITMSDEVSLLEKWETKIKNNILKKEQAA
ncbi:hypothetical protein ACFSSB_01625 [Lacinutrix gracilariae]|uniref:Uncharacterized protein n=1 Tax=Lacinutrix gracilariae TaxID=1747198 RepID=A0ABW5JYH1_9FLAO